MNILIPRQTQPTYRRHNIFNELTKKTRSSGEEPRANQDGQQSLCDAQSQTRARKSTYLQIRGVQGQQ